MQEKIAVRVSSPNEDYKREICFVLSGRDAEVL